MTGARTAIVAAVAAATALLAGCAATPPTDSAPAFEVLAARPPRPDEALRAADCEPLRARKERWAIVEATGADDPSTGTIEVSFETDGGRVVRRDPAGTRVLVRTADGGVALAEQFDASDGSTVRFTPPLALAPARLAPGDAPSAEAEAHTGKAGADDRDPGRAQRSIRIGAAERVRTPLGDFDALRVDATFSLKVPFASMRRETSAWVVPGLGPVAVRSDERILVMGIVPRNRSETRVLLTGDAR